MKALTHNQSTEVVKAVDEIINGINQGETVVFCGAGISRDSGLPIVNELVPYILEKLELPIEDIQLILDKDNCPRIPFEAFMETIKEKSNPKLIFNIYEEGEPNSSHFLIAKLIKAGKLKTIVTTNFDELIEKALSMGSNPMMRGKDYDLLYKEQDFENINWNNDRIRIVKIHGSIDDKETMAITLKQIASQILSLSRKIIIDELFLKGNHTNVLILGYSSSDMFDLSPQIQAIDKYQKKVFFIQHSDISKVEDIRKRFNKNPFKRFKNSHRLYYNTGNLIKKIWKSCLSMDEPYAKFTSKTDWQKQVDKWYLQISLKYSNAIKYAIIADIFEKMGLYNSALLYYKLSLRNAKKEGIRQNEGTYLGNLGRTYMNLAKYGKAIEKYKKALKIAEEIKDTQNLEIWYGSIGSVYRNKGDYREAFDYFEHALEIAIKIGNIEDQGVWLGNLGITCENLSRYKEAIAFYQRALKILKDIGAKQEEGICLGNLGYVFQDMGEYRNAIKEYFKKALKISKDIGDIKSEAVWFGSIGYVHLDMGKLKIAIPYFKKALKIAIDIGDIKNEGVWLGSIGNAYQDLGDIEKAIERYDKALEIAVSISDKQMQEAILGNLGNAYQQKDKNKESIKYYRKALKIAREIGDKQGEGLWLGNLGTANRNLGDYSKAIKYTGQGLKVAKKIIDIRNEGILLGNLGLDYIALKEFKRAILYFEQALVIAKKIENRIEEGVNNGNLGNAYQKLNKNKKAITYSEQALEILIPILGSNHPYTKIFKKNLQNAKSKVY